MHKNYVSPRFLSMLNWFRNIRTQRENPTPPEQLRQALAEMLSDPKSNMVLLRSLVGRVIPIEGGQCL